jgi:ATP/ADP translocase
VLLALLLVLIAGLIVALFLPMGVVRFARTGSISEALRFSMIAELIGKIGWGRYIIALIILLVAIIIFSIITTVLSLIPYVGWVLALVVTPLLTVFTARFYTLIYEQGEQQPVPA